MTTRPSWPARYPDELAKSFLEQAGIEVVLGE